MFNRNGFLAAIREDAVNALFGQNAKTLPVTAIKDSVVAVADALPNSLDMSKKERDAFIDEARDWTFLIASIKYTNAVTERFCSGELVEATKAHMKCFEDEWHENYDDGCRDEGFIEYAKEVMDEERERFEQYALSYFHDYRLPILLKEFEADFRKQWEETR